MASKEDIIKLVVSQTNYSNEEAEKKLKEHDYNYVAVIKEYLNPNFAEKKAPEKTRSLNEKMMDEIRGFMDTATKQYMIRKQNQERLEIIQKQMYEKMMQQKEESEASDNSNVEDSSKTSLTNSEDSENNN